MISLQVAQTEAGVYLLLVIRDLTKGMYVCFVTFLRIVICSWMWLLFRNWEFCVIGNLWIKKGSATAVNISGKTSVET